MKKITGLSTFILSACIAVSNSLNAQVYVPASNPETLLDAQFRINTNSALIDYSPICTTCGPAQLSAVSWGYNGGMPPGFIVKDGVGVPVTVSLPSNADEADIIIGNNIANNTNYLVGVVYNYISTIGGVTVDIYDIANVGTGGPLTATLVSSQTIAPLKCAYYPHIDVIAEYGNLFMGKPLCDRFVVSYDQNGSGSDIVGYYSSLNNPSSFIYQTMATNPSSYWYGPNDVAAIQRIDPTGTINDMALFTYTQGSNIYYQEWDITNGTVSALVTLDPAASTPFPRIDAIDDYNINDPTVSSPLAYFDVVNLNSNGSWTSNQVMNYNNKMAVGLDISTPYLGAAADPSFPRVTNGPCRSYTVAYPARYITGCDILAQNIDWITGYPTNYNGSLSNPFTNVRYYQVNFTYPGYGPSYATTVAGTCNGSPGSNQYVSFAFNDLVTPFSLQFYDKMTNCKMQFRGEEGSLAGMEMHWGLMPNPATDEITLTMDKATQGNRYTITDITGRQLQQAAITGAQQRIAIKDLVPGMYMLNVYSNDHEVNRLKFVKE